ncbi:MAG: FtsX-like permease family protein [Clostridia bacterium]|nr:FtsX-like permease family protein [Clostridia bacterium]
MKKNYLRLVFRGLWRGRSRIIAIFAIVALGVGFLAGLLSATPDMYASTDAYYDRTDMMDLQLVSTLGFTDADAEALTALDEVRAVQRAYSADLLLLSPAGDSIVTRLHSLPTEDLWINRADLLEGRMPQAADECLIEYMDESGGPQAAVGDVLIISDDNDAPEDKLAVSALKVVGRVASSCYFSTEKERSTVGNGTVGLVVYLPNAGFSYSVYTDLLVLIEGAEALDCFSEEYDALLDRAEAAVEAIRPAREQARYDSIAAEARDELNDAWAEYRAERTDAEAELAKAKRELADARQKLDDGHREYETGLHDLAEAKTEYATEIARAEQELADGQTALETQRAQLDAMRPMLDASTLAAYTAQLAAAEAQLADGRAALEGQKAKAEAEFASGERKLAEAKQELDRGEREYADGLADYETGLAEAEAEFADAERRLVEAEDDIAALEKPEWYIFTRADNLGYASFDGNAAKVAAIAAVFPIFFFLVAALVSLTTMTRMVEEERGLIGTLKALGYGGRQIAARYLFYAALTGILGSAVGLAIGLRLFPAVLWQVYEMMYDLPPLQILFIPRYVLIASLSMIACTMLATWSACSRTLVEQPAALLQPRAPKAGRRILLEHITPIWRRMKFTHKVTARNLFRYQKRLWMTIIGVAGCTALLVAGFGLRDSIGDIVDLQFGELMHYDLTVVLSDSDALDDNLRQVIADSEAVENYLPVAMRNVKVSAAGAERSLDASMVTAADDAEFGKYITLRERRGHASIAHGGMSVVITEKMGEELGVAVGDVITLLDDDKHRAEVTVTGITENYVAANVYLGQEAWLTAWGESPAYTMLYAMTDTPDEAARDALSTSLLLDDGVSALSYNDSLREQFDDLLTNINYIVVVLIICAGLLAFIVLYNLININVTERMREIATIKVLGFYDNEVAGYVFRETTILTLLGAAVGLGLGIFLHAFVVRTAEIEAIMFGRSIYPLSYVCSAAITLAFGGLVNLVMLRRLRNIDMVESLKSVD